MTIRKVFFHNGIYHDLHDVLRFYAARDTDPGRFYARGADGVVRKYDDLPAQYRANVNTDPPFGRRPGEKPALSDAEIEDIIAFLGTLTDGYEPLASPPEAGR